MTSIYDRDMHYYRVSDSSLSSRQVVSINNVSPLSHTTMTISIQILHQITLEMRHAVTNAVTPWRT